MAIESYVIQLLCTETFHSHCSSFCGLSGHIFQFHTSCNKAVACEHTFAVGFSLFAQFSTVFRVDGRTRVCFAVATTILLRIHVCGLAPRPQRRTPWWATAWRHCSPYLLQKPTQARTVKTHRFPSSPLYFAVPSCFSQRLISITVRMTLQRSVKFPAVPAVFLVFSVVSVSLKVSSILMAHRDLTPLAARPQRCEDPHERVTEHDGGLQCAVMGCRASVRLGAHRGQRALSQGEEGARVVRSQVARAKPGAVQLSGQARHTQDTPNDAHTHQYGHYSPPNMCRPCHFSARLQP